MPFSDTTNKNGIIQACERWTNLGDAAISGDATLKKEFTADINLAFDELLPLIMLSDSKWQWDDVNFTDAPIGTLDLVSGRIDYPFISDEDGNSILTLSAVYVKDPNGIFQKLQAVDSASDPDTDAIFAQNSTNAGTPTRYDKLGASIFLDPVPNYSQTAGVRAVFSRTASYFVSGDTTKTPGIPRPFHELLALIPSKKYVAIHKTDNRALLKVLLDAIAEQKANLSAFLSKRSKDEKPVLRIRAESSR